MKNKRLNSQGQRTKNRLVQAAIECLAEHGLHNTSFQTIADKCGLARPLVAYHFQEKSQIFTKVWDFIYEEALRKTESKLNVSGSAKEKILNYMRVSIEIFSEKKEVTFVYFQLHYMSAFNSDIRQKNTEIKRRAVNRIAVIIMAGQKSKEFKAELDPYLVAKMIHSSLVGILINSITEFEDFTLKDVLITFEEQILISLIRQ